MLTRIQDTLSEPIAMNAGKNTIQSTDQHIDIDEQGNISLIIQTGTIGDIGKSFGTIHFDCNDDLIQYILDNGTPTPFFFTIKAETYQLPIIKAITDIVALNFSLQFESIHPIKGLKPVNQKFDRYIIFYS